MNETENADMARIIKAAEDLGEHFDSVQIFCTNPEAEGTASFAHGVGNWFARYGHVRSWIIKRDEETRMDAQEQREGE